jgi:hypothetical protein
MLDINQPRQQAQLLGSNFSPSKILFCGGEGFKSECLVSLRDTTGYWYLLGFTKGQQSHACLCRPENTPATEWIHPGDVQS